MLKVKDGTPVIAVRRSADGAMEAVHGWRASTRQELLWRYSREARKIEYLHLDVKAGETFVLTDDEAAAVLGGGGLR